jgi:hypothetical protein
MCEWGDTVKMQLVIPARLSHSVKAYRKVVDVDRCIAPLVKALNDAGIRTVASCCGHGKGMGNIALADGRELEICPDFEAARRIDVMWDHLKGEGETNG